MKTKQAPMFKVWVNGATMVHGPGHLTEAKSAQWVETYRKINPDLPEGAIYTENTYFDNQQGTNYDSR